MSIDIRYIEKPQGQLRDELAQIWTSAFGDGEDVVSAFFELPDYKGVYFADEEGRAIGMAHLLGFDSYEKAYYVYAVATEVESRGKGVMKALMKSLCDMAEKEGAALILHPADEKLALTYGKMGFKTAAYSYVTECSGDTGRYSFISASEYKVMRELYHGGMGFYGWSSDVMTASGCRFIAFDIDGDYCAACIRGDTVIEVCAPYSAEGAACRRAAGAMGEKGRIMMFCDNPIGAEHAVMTYNCEKYGYFNMFLD